MIAARPTKWQNLSVNSLFDTYHLKADTFGDAVNEIDKQHNEERSNAQVSGAQIVTQECYDCTPGRE